MVVEICIGRPLPTCILQLTGVELVDPFFPVPECQLGLELLDRAPEAAEAPCILIAPVPKCHDGLAAQFGCQTRAKPSESALRHHILTRGMLKAAHVPAQHPLTG